MSRSTPDTQRPKHPIRKGLSVIFPARQRCRQALASAALLRPSPLLLQKCVGRYYSREILACSPMPQPCTLRTANSLRSTELPPVDVEGEKSWCNNCTRCNSLPRVRSMEADTFDAPDGHANDSRGCLCFLRPYPGFGGRGPLIMHPRGRLPGVPPPHPEPTRSDGEISVRRI